MKKIILTLFCLFTLSLLQGQDKFIKLSDEEKEFIALSVDTLLGKFVQFTSLTKNDTVDIELKKDYLWLFEDRATVINDFTPSNFKLSIQEYSNILSMQTAKATEPISYYPYTPLVLLDSITYDKLDDIYLVPVLLHKVLNYGLDTSNVLIKQPKQLNLRLTANIYKDDYIKTIANITTESSTEIIWKDCEGVVNGKATIFSACNDEDEFTINGHYQINCECRGTPVDCEGVPNGPAIVGTPCDDKDKNTKDDVYQDDCTCKGISIFDCTGEANGTAVIGSPCDDEDENTIDDVYNEDCICIGISILDCEGEPNGSAIVGSSCDDGDDQTGNDLYQEDCTCKGELIDCKGIPGGTALPGTKCGEDDDKFVNNIYKDDCTCAGIPLDCEGIPNGKSVPGSACDDKDKSTNNDVYQNDCTCKGEGLDRGFNLMVAPTALALYPFQESQSLYQHNLTAGGGIKIMFNTKRNKKLRFHMGAVYIPFASEFDGQFEATSVQVDASSTDNFEETPDAINIKSNENIIEKLNYNTLQIPIGVSYNILKLSNTELLIDLSFKPHFKLGTPSYELNVSSLQYEAIYTDFGETPLILGEGNYKETNEIETQYSNNSNLNLTQINESNINSPFAVGAGIQLLQKLGGKNTKKNSYIGIHIHNNFYLQQPGWKAAEGDIAESGFASDLINRISQAEDTQLNNALSEYHTKDTPTNFLEVGLSYIIKL